MNTRFESLFSGLVEKFSQSREFTVSFIFHAIIVLVLGTTVMMKTVETEPPEFTAGGDENSFVDRAPQKDMSAPQPHSEADKTLVDTTQYPTEPSPTQMLDIVTVSAPNTDRFTMPTQAHPPTPNMPSEMGKPVAPNHFGNNLTREAAQGIEQFTRLWRKEGPGRGSSNGIRDSEFEFTAYIGQYAGGDWDKTIERDATGAIINGSLPNMLYLVTDWSKGKIQTNYKKVKAVRLDSDEIFKEKLPFIFLTGTRDFKLTEREIENLRKYIRSGGCVWGDASVPGLRSRFDIAFRREMKRVVPDVDKQFEPLPASHPLFTGPSYFPEVRSAASGINNYSGSVEALKIFGEVAILYTSNDYGDMWRFGLTKEDKFDTARNTAGRFVAIPNTEFYNLRGIYLHGVNEESVTRSFKFGMNVVTHLLTRWETKIRNATPM